MGSAIDTIWLLTGWFWGLVYSLLVYAAKCYVLFLRKKWRSGKTAHP
jgi:hypothetical protein